MKTTLLGVLCLFISGWGSMQTALAQDLQEMEKSLSAINEELNQKTKEYSWQLVSAYADYCEANNKYISWNDVPYLQEIVEYNRPASLENYRLEHKVCKDALDKFLNTYKEYRELKKRQTEVVSKEEKEALSAAFSAFWKKLRSEDNAYKELYYAERKTVCKYRSEALRYMIEQYKKDNKAVPTSMIKYSDRSYLLQKGSALELLDKEVNALESVQRELVRKITRAKYGLTEAEEKYEKTFYLSDLPELSCMMSVCRTNVVCPSPFRYNALFMGVSG